MENERRTFIRPESLNLLDYLVIDSQGRQGSYSMARTLNVSEGGILMETHQHLPQGQQVMITLGLEDDLINVMGKIVYSKQSAGRTKSGVEFFQIAEKDKEVLEKYIKAFNNYFQK